MWMVFGILLLVGLVVVVYDLWKTNKKENGKEGGNDGEEVLPA